MPKIDQTTRKSAKTTSRKSAVASKRVAGKSPAAPKPVVKKAPAKASVKTKAKAGTTKGEGKPVAKKASAPAKASAKVAGKTTSRTKKTASQPILLEKTLGVLDDNKAESVVVIDLAGKSAIADYMIIASGRSQRHVASLAEHLHRALKENGMKTVNIEGARQGDWVLVDGGDIIVHLFRPEVREFYNLEKMWGMNLPAETD